MSTMCRGKFPVNTINGVVKYFNWIEKNFNFFIFAVSLMRCGAQCEWYTLNSVKNLKRSYTKVTPRLLLCSCRQPQFCKTKTFVIVFVLGFFLVLIYHWYTRTPNCNTKLDIYKKRIVNQPKNTHTIQRKKRESQFCFA